MTKTKDQRPKTVFIIFFVFIAATYLATLGALPLLGPDEPRYAQVAREMFERGDWVTPTLGGFNWFEKPALLYWLQIAAYKLFGVSEFSARFGSALFGLLTILTIYLLCKFAANAEETKDKGQRTKDDLAFWSAVVSASSVGLILFSHAATFDIILTFPVTAALTCFYVFQNPKSKIRNPIWVAGFYFFIGVGLLAKGLIGAVLPLGIVFFYFLTARKLPSKTFLLSLIWGAFVTLATAATWYLPMYLQHGWTFIDEFFLQHHFARYTSNKYQHPEPFWFFWAVLPGLALPWTPFLFVSIWKVFSRKGAKAQSQIEDCSRSSFSTFSRFHFSTFSPFHFFIFCWLLVPLVFFSFSGSKLPGYILPALPAALILTAEQVWRFVGSNQKRALILTALAAALLAFTVFVPFIFYDLARRDSAKFVATDAPAATEKVLSLHDISHSLEFYAAGRLIRTTDGRQRKFEGVGEIVAWMRENKERKVMIFVPLEYEHQLLETDLLMTKKISENGAFAFFAAEIR